MYQEAVFERKRKKKKKGFLGLHPHSMGEVRQDDLQSSQQVCNVLAVVLLENGWSHLRCNVTNKQEVIWFVIDLGYFLEIGRWGMDGLDNLKGLLLNGVFEKIW